MENWKRFINERKSDEEYIQAARFLSKSFSDMSKVDIEMRDPKDYNSKYGWFTDRKGFEDGVDDEGNNFKHKLFKIKLKNDSLASLWQKYQQITKQSVIFSDFETFKESLSKLTIYVAHQKNEQQSVRGDMDSNGTMRLFIGDKVDQIDIKNLLPIVTKMSYRTFVHEGTHYFNSIRAKGIQMRHSRGGAKVYVKGEDGGSSQEYKDSTEELQARIIEIQDEFMNMDWRENDDKRTLYDYLHDTPGGNDGIREFIKEFINAYYPYATEISEWHRKKVVSRVYQFAQRILSSEDYKEYVEYRRAQPEPQETETVALQERKRHVKKR